MNRLIIILFLLLLFNCDEKETKDILPNQATIYYYFDPGFGGSGCSIVIETINGDFFTALTNDPFLKDLDFSERENNYEGINVTIEYEIIDTDFVSPYGKCYHRRNKEFLEEFPKYVKILSLKKI